MGVQKHYKNRFEKNRVEKFLQKKRQKSKTGCFLFLDVCYHVFGRLLNEGSFKTRLKISGKKLTNPGTFWPPRNQPTTPRSVILFFEGPLDRAVARGPKKKIAESDVSAR
jgi:hypothetical protein